MKSVHKCTASIPKYPERWGRINFLLYINLIDLDWTSSFHQFPSPSLIPAPGHTRLPGACTRRLQQKSHATRVAYHGFPMAFPFIHFMKEVFSVLGGIGSCSASYRLIPSVRRPILRALPWSPADLTFFLFLHLLEEPRILGDTFHLANWTLLHGSELGYNMLQLQ